MLMLFIPMTLQSSQSSIIPLSSLPPISSLPPGLLVSRSWMAGGMASASSLSCVFLFPDCCDASWLWHVSTLRMQSLILSCLLARPWLSITAVFLVKNRRGKQCKASIAGSRHWISKSLLFHVLSPSSGHMSACEWWCRSVAQLNAFTRGQGVCLRIRLCCAEHYRVWRGAVFSI